MAHAHARGIQHRDIKPANILLTLQNGPQLLDFNLAHAPHDAEQAEAALRGGTLPYMAPEQLEAFLDPDCWDAVGVGADLYSLGLVMYELLTGQAPEVPDPSLPLPRAIQAMRDLRAHARFAPRRLNPIIPHALEAITLRCLADSPADRYAGAGSWPTTSGGSSAASRSGTRSTRRPPSASATGPAATCSSWGWPRSWAPPGSYPRIERLYPVEQRSSFRAALDALDAHRPDEAIVRLEPLVDQFPGSPVATFHLAVAHQQAGHVDEAARRYARSRLVPRADETLVGWGRAHPEAVRYFEGLAIALNDENRPRPGKTDDRRAPLDPRAPHEFHKHAELARLALKTSLRLGSTNMEVFVRAAALDELFNDFDSARATLGAMIAAVERRCHPRDRDQLLCTYECHILRADVALERSARLRSAGRRDAAGKALGEALEDLDRGKRLILSQDDPRWLKAEAVQAEAEIVLGDRDSGLGAATTR